MIVGTLTILLLIFSGGSLEFYLTHMKSDVKEHVQDKACQEIIIDAGDVLAKDLKALAGEIDAHFEDWVEVHSEYDSAASDFDKVVEDLKADQKKLSRLVLDTRDTMHDQMTKEEWKVVFAECPITVAGKGGTE